MFYVDQETNVNRPAAVREYSREGALSETDEYRCIMKEVQSTVLMKMQWACTQLQSSNLEESFKVLELIRACHQLLGTLQPSK